MSDEQPQPPPSPPWLRSPLLLPVVGLVLLGFILGSALVVRSIRKERGEYQPADYGPMDRRPAPVVQTNLPAQ